MKNSDTNTGRKETPVSLPTPLRISVAVSAALLALAGIPEFIFRFVIHRGYPYNSPLLYEHFPDILTLAPRFQHFHTLEFFTDTRDAPCMYPAPVAACYRALFAFSPHELAVFLSFVILSLVIAATLFGRFLIRHGLSASATICLLSFTLITSFPLWFELKQANVEIFSWIVIALGVWAFVRGRGYSAAACFGIAGAFKILPFFYLGLFVARKQYRPILVAFLSATFVTIPSLWLVYPNIAESWRLTNLAVSRFRTVVTLRMYPQLAFDHSLFGLIKKLVFWHINPYHLSDLLTIYSTIAAISMLVLFFGWIRKLPFPNQLLCLCVATLIVPPTSFDYTLMSLYLPWSILVLHAIQQQRRGQTSAGLVPAMVCFAVLFVPETEIIVHHQSIAGQIKAVTLMALLFIGLRYPFPLAAPYSEAGA